MLLLTLKYNRNPCPEPHVLGILVKCLRRMALGPFRISALPFIGAVTLDKLFNFSVPQFPYI